MAGPGRLEELELSAEEAERLQRAFRDERFRELFAEYAAELADPEQRRLYEEEVTALERERGVEVRFIHPTPGYVLRTSQAGSRRCYLNICSNPHVAPPQARAEPGGHRWALPHSLAPGREELGRAGRRCFVYDVVFHPAALRLAARSARFRRLLSDTAMEAVESRFAAQLDRANASVLRGARYKGIPQAPVIRSPLPGGAPRPRSDTDPPLPPVPGPPPAAPPPGPGPPPGPTTPRWSIRHRSYVDLQDYRCGRDSAPGPVPRELVVTVELPLLRSAAQAELEVRPRELRLDSRRPAYRLRLRLPYHVDESAGRAVFDKAKRQLLVTLPVVPSPGPGSPLGETGGERREEPRPDPELPEEPAAASSPQPRSEAASPSAGPEPGAACPAPSAGSEPAPPGGAPAPCPPEGSPGRMAHSRGGDDSGPAATAAVCPPFHCRQDEASLTLLLLVPGIQPHSLSGEVAANRYSLRFSSGAVAYALVLQFPAADRLAGPETAVSVGAHNAAITLAKAAGSAGLWEKFCFGLDASALQERLFVSEENVDGFLHAALRPSSCTQSELEAQTLIEVLNVSEDRSQIRLKPREAACSQRDETEQAVSSSGGDVAAKNNGDCLQTEPEPERTAAATAAERPAESKRASTSFATAETRGEADGASQYCLQQEPPATGAALPGKAEGKEHALDGALASLGLGEGRAGGAGSPAASPLLQEVGADGSVRSIADHSTRCAIAFQNAVLYELD